MSTLFSQARTRIPRFADAAVQRARLTVVPRRRVEAPRAPFLVLVAVLLTGGVAGLLAFNTSMQQSAFTATRLERQAEAIAAQTQSLQVDLERLNDPQQLAVRAKALGMVPAPNATFVELSTGTVLGRPLAATPNDAFRINPLPAVKPRVLDPKARIVKVPPPNDPTPGTTAKKKGGATGAASTDPNAATGKKKHPAGHQGATR